MKQSGFSFLKDYKKEFGGSLILGKRKTARPLSTKHPVHLILKSTGKSYFNPTNKKLEKIIRTQAFKYSIKIYDFSLNWSHIHLLMRFPTRHVYLAFVRTVSALIVSYLSKTLGKSLKGLFDLRPFTRVISWGRDFKNAFNYQELNQMEALGLIVRKKQAKLKPRRPAGWPDLREFEGSALDELRCPSGAGCRKNVKTQAKRNHP